MTVIRLLQFPPARAGIDRVRLGPGFINPLTTRPGVIGALRRTCRLGRGVRRCRPGKARPSWSWSPCDRSSCARVHATATDLISALAARQPGGRRQVDVPAEHVLTPPTHKASTDGFLGALWRVCASLAPEHEADDGVPIATLFARFNIVPVNAAK